MHEFYSFIRKKWRLGCLLVMGIYMTGCSGVGEEFILTDTEEKQEVITTGQEQETSTQDSVTQETVMQVTGQTEEAGTVFVFVCGQVAVPGVYELPAGSRIYDAIMQAGGCMETADICAVNQAGYLEDGMQIYIPAIGETYKEATSEEQASRTDGRISINHADKNELMTLPGIGESKADAILEYRQSHGAFSSIDELMNIPGIKEGIFNNIQDYIKVE